MRAHRLANSLTIVGVAGLVYFFFLSKNPFGTTLALCLVVGSAVINYSAQRPFTVPLMAWMLGLIVLLQLMRGELVAALLGGALGVGLPYWVNKRERGRA